MLVHTEQLEQLSVNNEDHQWFKRQNASFLPLNPSCATLRISAKELYVTPATPSGVSLLNSYKKPGNSNQICSSALCVHGRYLKPQARRFGEDIQFQQPCNSSLPVPVSFYCQIIASCQYNLPNLKRAHSDAARNTPQGIRKNIPSTRKQHFLRHNMTSRHSSNLILSNSIFLDRTQVLQKSMMR